MLYNILYAWKFVRSPMCNRELQWKAKITHCLSFSKAQAAPVGRCQRSVNRGVPQIGTFPPHNFSQPCSQYSFSLFPPAIYSKFWMLYWILSPPPKSFKYENHIQVLSHLDIFWSWGAQSGTLTVFFFKSVTYRPTQKTPCTTNPGFDLLCIHKWFTQFKVQLKY